MALLRFGLAVGHAHKSALPPPRLARLALAALVTLLLEPVLSNGQTPQTPAKP